MAGELYGHIPPEYATEINSIVAALQEMHNQPAASGNAVSSANIAALISNSMQWQRLALSGSDLDGLFGMTMPLLQRGVPVQIASLDRAADEGYLRPFKTLLLSYDFQKPPSARSQAALAQWVRDGGCLLFCGGSDAYNALPESWWRQAGLDAPQFDLWNQLGIALSGKAQKVTAPLEDPSRYSSVLKGDPQERENRNRRDYVVDLSSYAQQTGSVAVRFRDLSPADGWDPMLASAVSTSEANWPHSFWPAPIWRAASSSLITALVSTGRHGMRTAKPPGRTSSTTFLAASRSR